MSSTPPPRKMVMVIEDDPECLEAICDGLEYDGYEVVTATNGLEALRYLTANPAHPTPDLILLDLMMPVMDGWEFLRAQREKNTLRQIPVALLSGERELARRATELGVAGYIQKPISLDDLLKKVRDLIADQ